MKVCKDQAVLVFMHESADCRAAPRTTSDWNVYFSKAFDLGFISQVTTRFVMQKENQSPAGAAAAAGAGAAAAPPP